MLRGHHAAAPGGDPVTQKKTVDWLYRRYSNYSWDSGLTVNEDLVFRDGQDGA